MTSPSGAGAGRVVVTGASGDVGTALLRRVPADWSVTGLARRIPSGPPYQRIDWRACDLGSAAAPAVLADTLDHRGRGDPSSLGDQPADRRAADGPHQRAGHPSGAGRGRRRRVPHLVCLSSVAAYRPPTRWREVTEDWPCDGVPGSAYSQGKARLERLLDEFTADHPEIAVARLRPCAVMSREAGGQFARWLLSPLFPESLLGRRWCPLPFWRQLRAQLLHADDVADALLRVVRHRASGPFNLAAGPTLNTDDLAAAVGGWRLPVPRAAVVAGARLGWRASVQPVHPGWLRLADRAALANTLRARDELDWRPAHSSTAALADLITGMRLSLGAGSPPLAPTPPRWPADRWQAITWGQPTHQAQD